MTKVAEATRMNRRTAHREFAFVSVCTLTPNFEGTDRCDAQRIRTEAMDAGSWCLLLITSFHSTDLVTLLSLELAAELLTSRTHINGT